MDNIKEIVHQVITNIAAKKSQSLAALEKVWCNIIEEKAIRHVKLEGIKENKLLVHVDSSAWLYQMKSKKTHYLQRLRQDMPEITEIIFQLGTIK